MPIGAMVLSTISDIPTASSLYFPGNNPPLQLIEDQGEGITKDGDHDQSDIHHFHRQYLPGMPEHITKAALRADHFRARNKNQPPADPELYSRHHDRQSAGQGNGAKYLPAACLKILSDVEIDLINLQHAGHGVNANRIEHADGHHDDLGGLPQAENKQDQGKNRALRDRIGGGDQRVEQRAHGPVEPHDNAQSQSGYAAEQKSPKQTLQAGPGVGP